MRPCRYAYELAPGIPLAESEVLRNVCNIPICVRPDSGHLIAGTQRENMLDRVWDGWHANGATWRWRGVGGDIFAARSRALRNAALEHGWNPDNLDPLLSGIDSEAPTLF